MKETQCHEFEIIVNSSMFYCCLWFIILILKEMQLFFLFVSNICGFDYAQVPSDIPSEENLPGCQVSPRSPYFPTLGNAKEKVL